jgi:serine/threonine-protein kinase
MTEYRVMEPIDGDRGGFGRVFRAIRVTDGVAVAIKVLRDTASDYARQAFDREVKLLRELSHANIVQFVDEGSWDGSPFYAMELMSGPLTNWAGRLTDAQVRSALTEIAKGLDYLHRRGVVHRDVKLDNVMVSKSGRLAIGDFGLGKRRGATIALTVAAVGTPGYAAPELMDGRISKANKACDAYSLGALVFHLVTGVHPADAVRLLDPALYASNVAPDLRKLVLALTNTTPSMRPSPREVLRRLQQRAGNVAPRTPDWAVALGCGLLVVGGVALVSAIANSK